MNPIVSAKHGQDGDRNSDEETPAPEPLSPSERFLQKGSDGLWKLGPLPDLGTVRNADLGRALHVYITQQWSTSISIL